jgi:putative Ca2+/H+ antiporter (TMEM165/GDT1 family)
MLSLLLLAYGIVFVTELVGDKTLYTISALATRSRPVPLFCGISVAFMAKMLAAVMLGHALAALPPAVITGMSAATFFAVAFTLWRKHSEGGGAEPAPVRAWGQTFLVAFAAIFFSEWGDVGQITAATLAARTHAAGVIWLGATLALMTKGLLALTVGMSLRRWMPRRLLRLGACGVCLALGLVSAFRVAL